MLLLKKTSLTGPFVETWTHGFNDLADHVKDFAPEKVVGCHLG